MIGHSAAAASEDELAFDTYVALLPFRVNRYGLKNFTKSREVPRLLRIPEAFTGPSRLLTVVEYC
jgi:hypothetical protein